MTSTGEPVYCPWGVACEIAMEYLPLLCKEEVEVQIATGISVKGYSYDGFSNYPPNNVVYLFGFWRASTIISGNDLEDWSFERTAQVIESVAEGALLS